MSCQGRSSALPATATRKKEATLCNREWTWANGRDATTHQIGQICLSLSFYPPLIDWCRPFPPALLSHINNLVRVNGPHRQPDRFRNSAHANTWHPQSTNEQDTQKQNENQKQKDKTIVDDETQKQTHRGRCFLVTPNLVQVFILKRTTCDAAL